MNIDFSKYSDGLVPAIIQDARTQTILMLGFMNAESFQKTKESGKVTFFSRSRQALWMKGETSGNFLDVKEIFTDCDNDTILIKAVPHGPTCHTGAETCFGENKDTSSFLFELEGIITDRKNSPTESSYTSSLFKKGINKIAQKVGEEAVELVIEAKDQNDELFKNEAADLLYHFTVLMAARGVKLNEIIEILQHRHK